ncbi:uncharacterized protein TRIVIDRAFT_35306 [Trichoderma virens Gv29-8]|uniref:Uncharacterized protein n=1 Tax=Hypocrea virens (strain Gv29-8 / FGSC 10586) TaxID=413071 RepID=G9MFX0_HYPVG|nr:uncharacterized protein TRIVIDRAFT_35306 [Trichoderma virens Gv29-8]EHK26421.1 hypothetical protein TRIVIDRAFT_35306 [Trichoderma virens Gv29-8]
MAASRGNQIPDVEILVHVTAPSRTADDVAYRQLAQSYLSFQPQRRVDFTEDAVQEHRYEDVGGSPTQETVSSFNKDFSKVTSGQPWVPESQDLSFRSVYDNRFSPPLLERQGSADNSFLSEGGESLSTQLASPWRAPPSQVNDSYPLPDAEVLHATPTRVLEHYLKSLNASPPLRSSSAGQVANVDDSTSLASSSVNGGNIPSSIPIPPGLDEAASHSLGYRNVANTIPVTPRAPEVSTRKREEFSPTVINETIYIPSSDLVTTSEAASFRAESAPPLSKRQRGLIDEAEATNLQRSSSDTGPVRTNQPASTSFAVAKELTDALEIRPPSPSAGIMDIEPEDLISDKLAKLAKDLSSRYRPIAKRPTEPLERGYWLLDCTGWSQDTRLEAWVFLANYLRSGLAGWGVWCRRDESRNWIRLYCWAHVAKHMYLLLYLASGRHLKTTGAQWIDGDGEVVLEVSPVEKK